MSTQDPFEVEIDDDKKGLYKINIDGERHSSSGESQSFWKKYRDKLTIGVGIILIAAISYEAGFLNGQKHQMKPVIINQPNSDTFQNLESANASKSEDNAPLQTNAATTSTLQASESQKCAYVGSKNSNKYHLPSCIWAQKIKPENRVCFSSQQDAESRGYQPAKDCIK